MTRLRFGRFSDEFNVLKSCIHSVAGLPATTHKEDRGVLVVSHGIQLGPFPKPLLQPRGEKNFYDLLRPAQL